MKKLLAKNLYPTPLAGYLALASVGLVLVLFFAIVGQLFRPEYGLELKEPSCFLSTGCPDETIFVEIKKDGVWLSTRMDLSDRVKLQDADLDFLAHKNKLKSGQMTAYLMIQRNLETSKMVQTIDHLRGYGFEHVALAAVD